MTHIIRQTATVPASPKAVYESLMDSRLHAKMTGAKARIAPKVGGKISAYGGYITGRNLLLLPGKLIIQSWHAADWPKGHESLVRFQLQKVPGGTRIAFTHWDVPADRVATIKQGWIDNYWIPMKLHFRSANQAGRKKKTA